MKLSWEHLFGAVGLVLLVAGHLNGLFYSPPGQDFGDVVRIVYVHVPSAWASMVVFLIAAVAALGYLVTNRPGFDWMTEAAIEVGVMFGLLLCLTGAIFARPTWNTYWTWDPRLVATAVLVLTFVGVLVLRSLVADPERRAMWTSVITVLAAVNVPITYYSTEWWRSQHQMTMDRGDIDDPLFWVLVLNLAAYSLITVWFIAQRWRVARAAALAEAPPPLPEEELA